MDNIMAQLDTFSICKNIAHRLLSVSGCSNEYTSWSNDFVRSEIKDCYKKIISELNGENIEFDISKLNKQQMLDLGCRIWDTESNIMLLPIWLLPILRAVTPDLRLTAIDGGTSLISELEDNDVRQGVLAWGVTTYVE